MNLILCGHTGKTGRIIYDYLKEKKELQIVGVVNSTTPSLEQQITNNLVDGIIDFTTAEVAFSHAIIALTHHIPFLSGTTGFSQEQVEQLDELAKANHVGCLVCANFSPGINALKKIIPLLDSQFSDISIRETHHLSKKDAPSGTALLLKNAFKQKNNIPIESIRGELPLMQHEIIFSSAYESLHFIHQVKDRKVYAEGVYQALKKLSTVEGFQTMC